MPVAQNVGVESVKATINSHEENCQKTQPLPTINNLPAVRGGESGFTLERKRRTSAPSNPTTKG